MVGSMQELLTSMQITAFCPVSDDSKQLTRLFPGELPVIHAQARGSTANQAAKEVTAKSTKTYSRVVADRSHGPSRPLS